MLNQKWEEHHEMIDAELHGGNFLLRRNCSCAVKAVNGNLDRAMFPSPQKDLCHCFCMCRNAGATVLELQLEFDGLP